MIDVEIKARCENHDFIRAKLKELGARLYGYDKQTDIYFNSENGRLKLRKGEIEGALVYYERENIKGIKPSNFSLFKPENPEQLEEILRKALGVKVEVVKKREMYFYDNVKFNIDEVEGLGNFIEIEAMTEDPNEIDYLKILVRDYLLLFQINETDIQSLSYSDLLLEKHVKE
ncbi:MAG: class IV adenylate cyclase [Candidatus Thorarchaeota archaeon]